MINQQIESFFREKKYELVLKKYLEDNLIFDIENATNLNNTKMFFNSLVNAGYFTKAIELITKYLIKNQNIYDEFRIEMLLLLIEAHFNSYSYSEGDIILQNLKHELSQNPTIPEYNYYSCLYELYKATFTRLPEEYTQTEEKLTKLINNYRQKGDQEKIAFLLLRRAFFYRVNRNNEAMFADFEEAFYIHSEMGNKFGQAIVYFQKGHSYSILDKSELELALLNFEKSSAIFKELGNMNQYAHSLAYIGDIYNKKGEISTATKILLNALKIEKVFDKDYYDTDTKETLATTCFKSGDLDQALKYFLEAEQFYRKGNLKSLGGVLNQIGRVKSSQGKFITSLEYHNEALEIFTSIKDLLGIPWTNIYLGESKFEMGDFDGALNSWLRCYEQFTELQNPFGLGFSSVYIGKVYLLLNNEKAIKYYQESIKIFEKIENDEGKAEAYIGYGIILEERNQQEEADIYFNKARAIINNAEKQNASLGDKLYNYCLLSLENSLGKGKNYNKSYLSLITAYFNRVQENKKNKLRKTFLQAVKLNLTSRLREKTKAFELFESITKNEIIHYYTTLLSYLYILEISIFELKTFNNPDILVDVNNILDELVNLTSSNNFSSWAVRTIALKAQVKIIELDYEEAKKLLNEAINIAVSKNMNRLAFQLSNQYDEMVNQIVKLDELKSRRTVESSLSDILEITDFSIFDSNRNKFNLEIPNEEPTYLSLINTSGVTLFSVNFNVGTGTLKEDFDQLISGFLIALNSVILKLFASSGFIERIKHKEYTISLYSLIDTIYICYAYKGSSYHAQNKITELKEQLLKGEFIESILDASNKKRTLNQTESAMVENVIAKYFTNYVLTR